MRSAFGIDESHPDHSPQWGRGAAARRGAGGGAGARTSGSGEGRPESGSGEGRPESGSGEGRPEGTLQGRSQEDLDHELGELSC